MMIDLENIHSLTDFQRNVKTHMRDMKKSGEPIVLTVNGEAALVVQDARAYQELLEKLELADSLEGIKRGLEAVKRGDVQPVKEAFDEVRKKHGVSRRRRSSGKG